MRNVLQDPIIIIGAPRSGTTFLGRILSHDQEVAYSIEPNLVWRRNLRSRSDFLRAEDATEERTQFIRSYFEDFVKRRKKYRLMEKTPQNSMRMAFVDKVFPDARFVHIIRNGEESITSIENHWRKRASGIPARRLRKRLQEASVSDAFYYSLRVFRRMAKRYCIQKSKNPEVWGPLIPGIWSMRKDLTVLEIAALQWRFCVEMACDFGRNLPPSRYREIRLEELDPRCILELVQWLGLANEEDVIKAFQKSFSKERVGYRASGVSDEEKSRIRPFIASTQKTLGYW